ncbi:MAG TPA: lytic murein transglycosylase [Stellaceae bacterium]|nr:lytic murein transglycosylase [Stellaceae bacterium]
MLPISRLFLLCLLSIGAAAPVRAAEMDFAQWLDGVRQEALASGISGPTVELALGDGLEPIERVIELDRGQPETTQTYEQYLRHVVNPRRKAARRQLAANRPLLAEVAQRYGVQPRFIVALWGIESSFGRGSGKFPVVGALATLAYDGRRSDFFRGELMNALKIIDQDHLDPKDMLGSWAGAMGQSQFMPSSFLLYAVSYQGDGPRDIWHNRPDVFASIANYLSQSGWHGDQSWGRAVRLPKGVDPALVGLDVQKSEREWRALGVKRSDGRALAAGDLIASVLRPGGEQGPALLVYDNFRVLMKWNNSSYFASAVGFLADSME